MRLVAASFRRAQAGATLRELERKVILPDFPASRYIRLKETTVPIAPIAEAVADQL